MTTTRPPCGPDCQTCNAPTRAMPVFPGLEENASRLAASAAHRRATAAANNFPTERKPVRGGGGA